MNKFIGIDPGLSGAVAFIDGDDLTIWDMPVREVITGKTLRRIRGSKKGGQHVREVPTIKRHLDIRGLSDILYDLDGIYFVEKITPQQKNGHMGTFIQGIGVGAIAGILAAFEETPVEVSPQRWKNHFGLAGRDKNASRHLAMEKFPRHVGLFSRVKDDGRAEAALLACYGRETGVT